MSWYEKDIKQGFSGRIPMAQLTGTGYFSEFDLLVAIVNWYQTNRPVLAMEDAQWGMAFHLLSFERNDNGQDEEGVG